MPRHAVRHRRVVNAPTVALDACRGVAVRSTLFQYDVLILRTLAHRRVGRSAPI
jgi:hypothetical protein